MKGGRGGEDIEVVSPLRSPIPLLDEPASVAVSVVDLSEMQAKTPVPVIVTSEPPADAATVEEGSDGAIECEGSDGGL